MEKGESQNDERLENDSASKLRRRAIDQMVFGSVTLLWGCLLILKEIGVIVENVSTWPFPLALFGVLLIAGGVYRLNMYRAESPGKVSGR